jgi:hypothetical protein
MLIGEGERAIAESRFVDARRSFLLALQQGQGASAHADPYLIQRLALATYKAKQPDETSALNQALDLLSANFNLPESNDPETVGLAGEIEELLFARGHGADHLNRAIGFYSRGYYLRNDRYNGINLAYVLNVRMDSPLDTTREERIADFVWANRIRREVLALCEQERQEIRKRELRVVTRSGPAGPDQEKREREQKFWEKRDREQKYWCLAVEAEAHFGLGEFDAYEKTLAEIPATPHATWMFEAMEQQVERLSALLQKHGALVQPPWNRPQSTAHYPS